MEKTSGKSLEHIQKGNCVCMKSGDEFLGIYLIIEVFSSAVSPDTLVEVEFLGDINPVIFSVEAKYLLEIPDPQDFARNIWKEIQESQERILTISKAKLHALLYFIMK